MSDETPLPPLTSSAAASPVKTSHWPAVALASRASALACGVSTRESFARFDHGTSSWRTSQLSVVEDLDRFSESWPRSGTMRGGIVYQLPPSAPLTRETDCSSWPTPRASAGHSAWAGTKDATLIRRAESGFGVNLAEAVQMRERGLWPTPNTIGFRSDGELGLLAKAWWPTPTVAMHKGSSERAMTRRDDPSRLNARLDYATERGEIKRGRLNPTWVEWLMGFPLGWSALEPSATPLSRKSRKSSGG